MPTAKIVFLFNLLLDLNDIYIEIRKYINSVSKIDNELLKTLQHDLEIFNKYFDITSKIIVNLKDEPYYTEYEKYVSVLVFDLKMLYDTLELMYKKISNQLNYTNNTSEIISNIKAESIQLMTFTDIYSKHMEDFQTIINNNDIQLSYLKSLDNKRYLDLVDSDLG